MAPEKQDITAEFGATDFICAANTEPVEAIMDMTSGGVDHALECIGLSHTAEQAFAMLKKGGTATIVGVMPPDANVTISGAALLIERKIQGSFLGSNRFPVDMPQLVDFYMQGKLNLDRLISRRLRLDEINDGFDEMKAGALARSVVIFEAGSGVPATAAT